MKLHKIFYLAAAGLALAILSTGCQSGENPTPESTTNTSASTTSQTYITEVTDSEMSAEDEAITFTGKLGETLCIDDAAAVDENTYRFEGWTYMGLSDGVAWNTIDQGDGIVESDFPAQTIELFKVEEGYAIGDLTLEKAAVEFNSGFSGIGIGVINAEFSGQLALEGYFYTFPDVDGYEEKGNIFFLVCDGEWSGMPYVNVNNGRSHWWTDDDFHWIANAPILRLGNIEDYDFDLSFIKADGDVVHASVVLNGLELDTGVNAGGLFYKSTIVEAEPI